MMTDQSAVESWPSSGECAHTDPLDPSDPDAAPGRWDRSIGSIIHQ